ISAQGFQAFTAKGVEIQANRIATFDAQLQTGGAEVVVEVNAGTAEILQKSDAVRGGNFDRKEVTQLPTSQFNPYNLARLLPGGVIPSGNNRLRQRNGFVNKRIPAARQQLYVGWS